MRSESLEFKWKKYWAILYRESICSIARLELFECSSPPEKVKKQDSKKLIKMSDCVCVAEASEESSPKDTSAFLLETTDKLYLFAAEIPEQDSWISSLCELAFPMQRQEQKGRGQGSSLSMEDNFLYCTGSKVMKEFKVTVRKTEASERCGLWGSYILKTEADALELQDTNTGNISGMWPYRFLRRFGRDKVTFSFEAGRRCASGEGNFEFETRLGNEIFLAIESAISAQRYSGRECPQHNTYSTVGTSVTTREERTKEPKEKSSASNWLEAPGGNNLHLAGSRCLSLESSLEGRMTSLKSFNSCPISSAQTLAPRRKSSQPQDTKCLYSEPQLLVPGNSKTSKQKTEKQDQEAYLAESEYAVPFDTIAKSLMATSFATFLCDQDNHQLAPQPSTNSLLSPDALYDSIEELLTKRLQLPTSPKAENIYDEPEGVAGHMLYDEPEDIRSEAWKLQATNQDFTGHEYPYNSEVDDYAVPKPGTSQGRQAEKGGQGWLEEREYDNVVLQSSKKKTAQ
ncbi:docking protein 2 isoform X2 [Rhinatrema bivittatum]|uniref:docking protein 2 isoform X2 n=1 Tax=Rhinatrema bivittatum TaxID=194408 RepID=UPI00112A90B9|nr:docking protein 2 isoform X2 [Rhinatrema bivittatum]